MNYEEVMRALGVQSNRIEATPINARWFMREAARYREHYLYLDALRLARDVLNKEV